VEEGATRPLSCEEQADYLVIVVVIHLSLRIWLTEWPPTVFLIDLGQITRETLDQLARAGRDEVYAWSDQPTEGPGPQPFGPRGRPPRRR
jgi:hypothetical protein